MEAKNNKGTPTKRTTTNNKINLDYDYNTEYGDGDIPDIDKNKASNSSQSLVNNPEVDKNMISEDYHPLVKAIRKTPLC